MSMYSDRQRNTFQMRTENDDSNLLGRQGTEKNESLKTSSPYVNEQTSGERVKRVSLSSHWNRKGPTVLGNIQDFKNSSISGVTRGLREIVT